MEPHGVLCESVFMKPNYCVLMYVLAAKQSIVSTSAPKRTQGLIH